MNLKNTTYEELAKRIREQNSCVFVYGAGMIGQIVVPYIIDAWKLYDYVECYVARDARKAGKSIMIGTYAYEIKAPVVLNRKQLNYYQTNGLKPIGRSDDCVFG